LCICSKYWNNGWVTGCGAPVCSYTQGFWVIGWFGQDEEFIANIGDINIGHAGGFSIVIPTTDQSATSLNGMLPGGGTPIALTASCTNTATWMSCMATHYLTNQKEITMYFFLKQLL
jgi:hypothetical protein